MSAPVAPQNPQPATPTAHPRGRYLARLSLLALGVGYGEIATPGLQHWVIWITLAILVGLFAFQSRGTAMVGAVFGPVMLVWFGTIAVLGVNGIVRNPAVIGAVLPTNAIRFLAEDPGRGLL